MCAHADLYPTRAMAPRDYYGHPAVRRRIREYCGSCNRSPLTCLHFAAMTPGETMPQWETAARYPADALNHLLDAGADIARSLWDTENLLFHIDLDHHALDRPGEPFAHPADAFFELEPVFRVTHRVLGSYGIAPVALMTGRGYHFTGRIPLANPLIDRLAALVDAPPSWLASLPTRHPEGLPRALDVRHARAAVGIGLLVEYAAHDILRLACRRARVPVTVNGTDVGRGGDGRTCISVDFSYVGDPLDMRYIRVAFGAYQLHRLRPDIFGSASNAPVLVAVPRTRSSLYRLLTSTRYPSGAARLARHTDAQLPDVTAGVETLLNSYTRSSLAVFHRNFYSQAPHPPEQWATTYHQLDLDTLPPCAAWPLRQPNDLLLQPARLQHVVRTLMADGWHPRHIAGLVHSRYARDEGWGPRWQRMDARTRAEFDVRVFAGLVATGVDEGIDFNCVSAQEKGLCPWDSACHRDLRDHRARLLRRVPR